MISSTNNDVCTVAFSGAVQTQVLGISGGSSVRDMNCERLKLSKTLYDMGMKVAAVNKIKDTLSSKSMSNEEKDKAILDALKNLGINTSVDVDITTIVSIDEYGNVIVSEDVNVKGGVSNASHGTSLKYKRDKVKAEMIQRSKDLAKTVEEAKTLEEQSEAQNLALQFAGFNPDFTDYKVVMIKQPQFYVDRGYKETKVSKSTARNGLAQQILHTKMIEMQYTNLKFMKGE